jgi:hypothetical protein
MCKKALPVGSEHQLLAKAMLANLLRICQGEQGLNSLIAVGKDLEIIFRCLSTATRFRLLRSAADLARDSRGRAFCGSLEIPMDDSHVLGQVGG